MNKIDKPKKKKGNLAKPGQKPNRIYGNKRIEKRIASGKEVPRGYSKGGTKSLSEKLADANLLMAVCVSTRNFRIANPTSSYLDLYYHLNSLYPDFFPTDKKLYAGQNFSKQLHACKQWSAAYWAGHYTFDDLLETQLHSKLYNDELDNKDLVKVYDIRTKAKEANALVDSLNTDVNVEVKF